jgi:polysaccharide export outer membrane protein
MNGINRITTGIVAGLLCSSLPAWGQGQPIPTTAPIAPATTSAPAGPPATPIAAPATKIPSTPVPVVTPPGAPALPGNDVAVTAAYSALPRANAEYKLGPGDLIEVSVFGVDDYRHTIRISAGGVIKLSLIDSVDAAGLTAAQLEQRLAEMLGKDVIKNPQVSVFVKEYRSQPVYVLGAVRNPGQFQITMQMRIVDAISMAGGALPNAADEVTIQRPLADGGEQTIPVDLVKILETGDLRQNVLVQGGDVINVRARPVETIYVLGEVNRAGAYQKTPKQEVRVSQLLALAGGAMKTASLSKAVLMRYNEAGQRSEMPLNLQDIVRGKAPDMFLQANDVIFVPGSTMKSLGYGLMATVPGVISTIPYAVIP